MRQNVGGYSYNFSGSFKVITHTADSGFWTGIEINAGAVRDVRMLHCVRTCYY
jgi:hypothetical protein